MENNELGSNIDPLDHDGDGHKGGSLPKAARAKKPAKDLTERTWIILEENEEIPPGGQFFGHNGVGYTLRPGEAAYVPNFILEILDHAVTSVPTIDPLSRQVVAYRDRMRFPYRKVAAPESVE